MTASGLTMEDVGFGWAWADAIRQDKIAITRVRCMVRTPELLNMSLCCADGMVNSPNGPSPTPTVVGCSDSARSRLGKVDVMLQPKNIGWQFALKIHASAGAVW